MTTHVVNSETTKLIGIYNFAASNPRQCAMLVLVAGQVLGFAATPALAQVEDLYQGEADFDPSMIRCAVGSIFELIEGPFGALVMVISGLGAIIASAMGAYRAAVGMLVVAVGSFVLRSLVSLFFGTDYPGCSFDQ